MQLKYTRLRDIKFNTGESLSCFDYRAWGEGQPSHFKGCVALVNSPSERSPPFWKVMPCYTSLPFICEISPLPQRSFRQYHKNHHNNKEYNHNKVRNYNM